MFPPFSHDMIAYFLPFFQVPTSQPVANPREKILTKEDISNISLNTSTGGLSHTSSNPNILQTANTIPTQPTLNTSSSNISNTPILLQSMNNNPLNSNIPLNTSSSSIPLNMSTGINNPSASFNNMSTINTLNNLNSTPTSLNSSSNAINNLSSLNNSNASITPTPTTATTTTSPNLNTPNSLNSSVGANNEDQYDLLGLLKVLKMTNLNLNILAFGTDLTTLGTIFRLFFRCFIFVFGVVERF